MGGSFNTIGLRNIGGKSHISLAYLTICRHDSTNAALLGHLCAGETGARAAQLRRGCSLHAPPLRPLFDFYRVRLVLTISSQFCILVVFFVLFCFLLLTRALVFTPQNVHRKKRGGKKGTLWPCQVGVALHVMQQSLCIRPDLTGLPFFALF